MSSFDWTCSFDAKMSTSSDLKLYPRIVMNAAELLVMLLARGIMDTEVELDDEGGLRLLFNHSEFCGFSVLVLPSGMLAYAGFAGDDSWSGSVKFDHRIPDDIWDGVRCVVQYQGD